MAPEEDHSSSEQILITDHSGRERRKPVAGYLMDEMLSFPMTDSPSLRQTVQKRLLRGDQTPGGADRGLKFKGKTITIYLPSDENKRHNE